MTHKADRQLTRRAFLGTSAAGAASLAAQAYGRVVGAADRLNVAVIGSGHRGRELIRELHASSQELNARVVAICDLWKVARELGVEAVRSLTGESPAAHKNTESLYAAKDIDAVIIASADHQHAKMCVEAVKAKKDVYVEKPLAHFFDDAVEAHRAVRESDRVVQMGTQRRSNPRYQAAAEFVRSGRFGDVVGAELRCNVNQPGRWRRVEEVARLKEEDTDWNRFRMHLPPDRFDPRKVLEFRLFWPYSSGIPDQWLSHLIDVVPWITGDPFPRSCVASGGLHSFRDGRQNPDMFAATFEYPRGFQVQFNSRLNNSDGGMSEVYYSTWGKLDLTRGIATGDGGGDPAVAGSRRLEETVSFPDSGGASHVRRFLECVRSRRTPNADIDAGFQHSVAVCMAIEAYLSGKRIGFDQKKVELVSL